MLPLPPKGRRALFIVHDPKFHEWSLRIGYLSSERPDSRRQHRGMLPDVDFSRAVPDQSRRSLLRRVIDLIRRERRFREPEPDPDAAVSGSSAGSVGETVPSIYNLPDGSGERRASKRTETEHWDARAA